MVKCLPNLVENKLTDPRTSKSQKKKSPPNDKTKTMMSRDIVVKQAIFKGKY